MLAFYYCKSLTSITIPYSVTNIGKRAFVCCDNLSDIMVDPDNPYYCSVNGILFNKEQTRICCYPMKKDILHYEIPQTVTTIEDRAFAFNDFLISVLIPNSVTTIEECAFTTCNSLTSVIIPNSVSTIGRWAFSSCDGLKSLYLPESIKQIEEYAFYSCYNLESIYYDTNEPIVTTEDVFDDYSKPTLYVKDSAMDKIKETTPWNKFNNIEVYDFSDIEDIIVEKDEPIEVYNFNGIKVSNKIDGLAPGIYIIRQGNKVEKIAVN